MTATEAHPVQATSAPAGKRGLGYLPGLDGIRALAVIGVLLYHADLPWFPGGFLGVDVFFVLSGFLITSLLLEEYARRGRIDFKEFYLRRARRLLPALFLVLAVVAVGAAFFWRDAAAQVRQDTLAALGYVTNWWYIVAEQSYFEAIGRPAMLQHLWSLAVEEQFYLVWPVVVLLVLGLRGRRGLLVVAAAGAVLSTLLMVVLSVRNGFPVDADPSRVYFGTDTHAMGLMAGAALATVWRPGALRGDLRAGAAAVVDAVGVAALAAVLWTFVQTKEYSPALYRGGFLVLSLAVVALIAAASHPGGHLGRWLGVQPLRWFGERSYGLYLWHWPIFMVTRPGLDMPLEGAPAFLLRLGLTCGIAELSYRYVETPIRHGAVGRAWKRLRDPDLEARRRAQQRFAAVASATLGGVVLVGAVLASAPRPDGAEILVAGQETSVTIDDDPAATGPAVPAATGPSGLPSGTADPAANPTPDGSGAPSGSPTGDPGAAPSGTAATAVVPPGASPRPSDGTSLGRVTAIGDSVLLGSRVTLRREIPGARVDAAVGRQASEVVDRIRSIRSSGKMAPVVVLHMGTNGVVTEGQLRDMLDMLADRRRVVVVNSHVPRPWQDDNNATIAAVVPDYPNVRVADWHAASADHDDDYFVRDGVHLTGDGMRAFAALVLATALEP